MELKSNTGLHNHVLQTTVELYSVGVYAWSIPGLEKLRPPQKNASSWPSRTKCHHPPQHHSLKSMVVTETLPISRSPLNINYNFQSLDDLPKSSIEFILQPEYSQVQC